MSLCRVLIALALVLAGNAHAQGWAPQKNVEIVAPVPPGGTIDKFARSLERSMVGGKMLTSSVTVVNKPGGGNQIAYAYVSQHAGDPHYLLIGTTTLLTSHITGASKLTYTDFTMIASLFNDYIAFAVNPASAVRDGKDLIARMRSEPQSMTIGFSPTLGAHHHIIAGLFMKAIGASPRDLKPVAFRVSAEALTALLGGHIELVSTGAGNAALHLASGKLRVVGVAAPLRLPGTMAVVPTWREQGIDLVYGSWRTIAAPRGVTQEQAAFWEGVLRRVSETPEWKADLERFYWSDFFATGTQLRQNLEREYAAMKAVLVELGYARQ
jgi:putative tricarboxylic transport membrane protein